MQELETNVRRGILAALSGALLVATLQACTYEPSPPRQADIPVDTSASRKARKSGDVQKVTASYYGEGDGFDGKQTASGETFRKNGFTAAHRSLPFGTMLSLRDPATGKSVEVRVNDRGPFVKDRSLDLSAAAAHQLGFKEKGVKELEMTVLPASNTLSRNDEK